jgi:two-component system chemotaxis response regulator CheY
MLLNNLSVLIADDLPMMRQLLASILRSLGVTQIDEVSNGDDVVAAYHNKPPDLLFLDISMPVKNGLETLKEIIAIAPNAFVAMVTAHSSIDHVKSSLELGAKGFVVKPYSMGKIEDILKTFSEQAHA